jgi:hypothetical protein
VSEKMGAVRDPRPVRKELLFHISRRLVQWKYS